MDCSLPGSSVHGIFQARILEWVAISFSRWSSQPRDRTWVSRVVGRRITIWATREALSHLLFNNQFIANSSSVYCYTESEQCSSKPWGFTSIKSEMYLHKLLSRIFFISNLKLQQTLYVYWLMEWDEVFEINLHLNRLVYCF